MADSRPSRCAPAALARDEPLVGTASRVRYWLVVEQWGPWGADALLESRLPAAVATALAASAGRHRVRVLLARRPGDRRHEGDRRVFLAHTGADGSWIEHLDVPPGQLDDLAALDLAAVARAEPPGIGAPGPDGLVLVCTNGRHDPCCADHGRPVVRALAAAGVDDVWECSHVGGDRFAANVVVLPDGTYYGRVDPATAADLVAAHRSGHLTLERYRGRSHLSPVAQAADLFARRHLDETRLDGLTVRSSTAGEDGTTTVVVEQRGGATVEVVVASDRRDDPVRLTCHADREGRPWAYRLVEVRAP